MKNSLWLFTLTLLMCQVGSAQKTIRGSELSAKLSLLIEDGELQGRFRSGRECLVTQTRSTSRITVVAIDGLKNDTIHSSVAFSDKDSFAVSESENNGTRFSRYQLIPKLNLKITRPPFFISITKNESGVDITISDTGKRLDMLTCFSSGPIPSDKPANETTDNKKVDY